MTADASLSADQALGMSDEDFLNVDVNSFDAESATEVFDGTELTDEIAEDGEGEAEPSGESVAEAADAQGTEETADEEVSAESSDQEEDTEEEAEEGDTSEEDSTDEEDADTENSDEASESDETSKADSETDYETLYRQVTAPFKANGKEMQVDNPDDVIRLMQMGANYNRKMAALKPNLKVLKTLENNKLLDEEKINFLIDLDKGDPKAIAKLMKDRNLDLDSLDEAGDYTQNTYTADDREVELDTVIDEIKDSKTYNKTIDVVGNRWDEQSKQIVAETPQLLKVIDAHMASGIYDLISTEVERERVLGRLDGKSDIEAYKMIGDLLQERGAFNQVSQNQPKAEPEPKETPKSDKQASTRRNKRRAASPTKPAAAAAKAEDFNPLGLSDEDFAKQYDPRLM